MKTIKSAPNYLVDEYGNVFNKKTGKQLKPQKNMKGYLMIMLRHENKSMVKIISRLVYENYFGEIPYKMEINHIDGNKINNHISNLELVTHHENVMKAVKTGLIKSGMHSKFSKSLLAINFKTNDYKIFGSIAEASKYLKCSTGFVSNTCSFNEKNEKNLKYGRTVKGYLVRYFEKDMLNSEEVKNYMIKENEL